MVVKYSLLAKLPEDSDACVGRASLGRGQCAPGFKGLARGQPGWRNCQEVCLCDRGEERARVWVLRPQSNFLANPSNREFQTPNMILKGFPGGSVVKNLSANAGDLGSIPGLGRSPEEGNDNPLQYYGLGKSLRQRSLAGSHPWDYKELDMT